jgi:exosortase
LALGIHALGVRAELLRLSMISFILILYGMILFFTGYQWLKELLFPVGFLIFGFPFPLYIESVTFPMKLLAAKVSVVLMEAVGWSVYRQGTVIYLPKMTMGVADACSGLRSLVLVIGVAAFYSYVYMKNPLKRISFLLLSIPIALIANIVRILITGVVGYYWGMGKAFDFVHDTSGLLILAVAGFCLVMVDAALTSAQRYIGRKKNTGNMTEE